MKHVIRSTIVLSALFLVIPSNTAGIPVPPPTFRELLENLDSIVVVQLKPHPDDVLKFAPEADLIEVIANRHPIAKGAKTLRMDIPYPNSPGLTAKPFIVFGERDGDKVHWHAGIVADAVAVNCIKGLAKLDVKDRRQVLRFAFDFLKSPNPQIAERAFGEWYHARPADLNRVAKKLPAAKVRAIVQDAEAPRSLRQVASLILGHCGEEKDAATIRQLFETEPDAHRHAVSYRTYSLKGYVILKPRDGWAYLSAKLKDTRNSGDRQWECLWTARYFYEDYPEVIAKRDVEKLLAETLDDATLADLIINDFVRWKCWNHTDRILALFGRPTHQNPYMRKAILRYALQCPDAAGADFVVERRSKDPGLVAEVVERLQSQALDEFSSKKVAESKPTQKDAALEKLTAAETRLIRNAVYDKGPQVGFNFKKGVPPIRKLAVPNDVATMYRNKPVATLLLLLRIVEGGRPSDALHADSLICALVVSPEAGALSSYFPVEEFDNLTENKTETYRDRIYANAVDCVREVEKRRAKETTK